MQHHCVLRLNNTPTLAKPVSYSRRDVRVAEGARLESVCAHKAPRVQIPLSPL